MKNKKIPMRKCVGCMESRPKSELVRIACYEGRISVDPAGRAKGRGVYLCHDEECIRKAKKKKVFQRNFNVDMSEAEIEEVFGELERYAQKD